MLTYLYIISLSLFSCVVFLNYSDRIVYLNKYWNWNCNIWKI